MTQEQQDAYDKARSEILDAARRTRMGRPVTFIDLAHRNLSVLPPEIRKLTALTRLDLSGNRLTALSPEIGQLPALKDLLLHNNQLTKLPAEIGQLISLKELYLHNNQLTALPPEIGQLTALTQLHLFRNRLTALPPEIKQMTALTQLNLYFNQLRKLPSEIGKLTALTQLTLQNNLLPELLPEIGTLILLKTLYLHNNQLTALPPEIGQLSALESLYLYDNQLKTLPEEIKQLKELRYLFLHSNPDLNLPAEVLGPARGDVFAGEQLQPASPKGILDYYFGLQKAATAGETQALNEAKVLVLGQPEAGKSSLIHALTTSVPTPDFPKTNGIARREWLLKVRNGSVVPERSRNAETLRLNLWDFGGQEIYKSTHTFFLTKRAVYIIVTTARKDTSMDADLEEWLETAQTFGGGAPVWVVINKHDENPRGGPDEGALIRKYYPMLRGFIRTQCQHSSSGPDKGTGAGLGIDELRDTLVREAWAMPEVRQVMSSTSLAIKRRLEKMTEPTLTMDEYRAICAKCGESGENLQIILLDLWDKLGTVRYFPDKETDSAPAECETAILKPEWVTEAVYRILEDPRLKAAGGLVTENDFARIMKGTHHPTASYHLIESVMRRFSQLYDSGDGRMFIPQLLDDKEPEMDWPVSDALLFVYEYPVLPAGLMPQFIAGMSRWHSPSIRPWRKGCVLEIDGCHVRVIGDKKARQVEISVARGEPRHRRDALDKVRFKFEELHRAVTGLNAVRELIPVPGAPEAPLLDYRFLRTLEDSRIDTYPAPADAKSSTIIQVNVAQALGGIRGSAMQSRENERSESGGVTIINNNIAGDAEGNAFGERSRVSTSH